MVKRILRNAIAVSAVVSMVAGCGEKKPVDPYPRVTLRQITRGKVVSKGFRYKLVNPEVQVLNQSLGLIREGDILEFIGARNLEEKLQGKLDGDFELAVVKEFSPFVHFRVEKIYTAADTTFLASTGTLPYPRIQSAAGFRMGAYEPLSIDDVQYDRTDMLQALENKKFRITAQITRETEDGRAHYILLGGNAKFRVSDPPDGTGLFLKLLVEKGYPFEGGVLMRATEEHSSRMRSKIAGTVEVEYVKYGLRIVSG